MAINESNNLITLNEYNELKLELIIFKQTIMLENEEKYKILENKIYDLKNTNRLLNNRINELENNYKYNIKFQIKKIENIINNYK
jgi:hypothetical protein